MSLGSKLVRMVLADVNNNNPHQSLDRLILFDEEGFPITLETLMESSSEILQVIKDETAERTIYCSPTGTGTGESVDLPTTLQNAIDLVSDSGLVRHDIWTIVLAPGTYPAPSWPRRFITDNYVKIIGPTPTPISETLRGWNGSAFVDMAFSTPGEPTAIIDAGAGGSTSRGIIAQDGTMLWVENVETKNFSVTGFDADCAQRVTLINHWDRGSARGRYFKRTRYTAAGGRLINNTTYGVSELFGVTRDYTYAETLAEQYGTDASSTTSHKNNAIPYGTRIINSAKFGLHSKEHCQGHTDYLTIEDCPNAFSLHSQCVANIGNMVIRQGPLARVQIGITLNDSEIHEFTGIEWNYGTVNYDSLVNIPVPVLPMGRSTVLDDYWDGEVDDDAAYTARDGRGQPATVKSDYAAATYTGTVVETQLGFYTLGAKRLASKGSRLLATFAGRLIQSSSGSTNIRFLIRFGGTYVTEVTVPVPQTSGRDFEIELSVRTAVDGGSQQLVQAKLLQGGQIIQLARARPSLDYTVDHSWAISVILASTANSVQIDRQEWAIT